MFEPRCVDDVDRWLQNILEPEFLRMEEVRHDVFAVDKTTDVVKRLAIHRQTRITMLLKRFRDLCEIAGVRNRRHLRPRHHRLAYDRIGKLEHTMYQATFFRAKMSAFARDVDQSSQFLLRVR